MSEEKIELDKSLVDIMKDLPDSGTVHPEVIRKEAGLRKNHADLWLDKTPWANQFLHWSSLASECVAASLGISSKNYDRDMLVLSMFKNYEPDFEDTLI